MPAGLVLRLRGGVLMGSSSLDNSLDSDAEPTPDGVSSLDTDADEVEHKKESVGFKSNVVVEQAESGHFQPHPDTLRRDDTDLLQRAQEAVRIPMGGGAAALATTLTPVVARHVSRAALSVFRTGISPALQRTSMRFAAAVSPFRVPSLTGVIPGGGGSGLRGRKGSQQPVPTCESRDARGPQVTAPCTPPHGRPCGAGAMLDDVDVDAVRARPVGSLSLYRRLVSAAVGKVPVCVVCMRARERVRV